MTLHDSLRPTAAALLAAEHKRRRPLPRATEEETPRVHAYCTCGRQLPDGAVPACVCGRKWRVL